MVLKNGSLEKSDKVSVKSYFILPVEICILLIMMMKEKIEMKKSASLTFLEGLSSCRTSALSEIVFMMHDVDLLYQIIFW